MVYNGNIFLESNLEDCYSLYGFNWNCPKVPYPILTEGNREEYALRYLFKKNNLITLKKCLINNIYQYLD